MSGPNGGVDPEWRGRFAAARRVSPTPRGGARARGDRRCSRSSSGRRSRAARGGARRRDARRRARRAPARRRAQRAVPAIVARGVPATLTVEVAGTEGRRLRVRQPRPPEIEVTPQEGDGGLRRAARRPAAREASRCRPPPCASIGPLGLATRDQRAGEDVAAARLPRPAVGAAARARRPHGALPRVRPASRAARSASGRSSSRSATTSPTTTSARSTGRRRRGMGRPMSNQYRIEQDRDVICVLDCGRLMAAPLSARRDAPRRRRRRRDRRRARRRRARRPLRHGRVRWRGPAPARAAPARGRGARARGLRPAARARRLRLRARVSQRRVVQARARDRLHRPHRGGRRALARSRPCRCSRAATRSSSRASSTPTSTPPLATRPAHELDVYRAAAALDVLAARERAAARVRGAGAQVLETAPGALVARVRRRVPQRKGARADLDRSALLRAPAGAGGPSRNRRP